MTKEEIESVCDAIFEITKEPSANGIVGYGGEITHIFKVTNNSIENHSHYSVQIDSYQDALEIVKCLDDTGKSKEDIENYLSVNSKYNQDSPLYFHYIKIL